MYVYVWSLGHSLFWLVNDCWGREEYFNIIVIITDTRRELVICFFYQSLFFTYLYVTEDYCMSKKKAYDLPHQHRYTNIGVEGCQQNL
jgi:hypothetical protein